MKVKDLQEVPTGNGRAWRKSGEKEECRILKTADGRSYNALLRCWEHVEKEAIVGDLATQIDASK